MSQVPARPQGASTDDPNRWKALWVCLSAAFMTMMYVSIVNVAIPSVEASLRASSTSLMLILAGYTLAFGLLLVPSGRIGDVKGRKVMFIIGVSGFGAMSLLAGFSTSGTMLAIIRLAQGAFAGILNPQISGLIQQMFHGFERGKAFGYMGATVGVSTAIGPLAGGLILDIAGPEHGWRWVFWIVAPISLIVVVLALKLLPSPPATASRQKLDTVGTLIIGIATVAFMFPFVFNGQGTGTSDPRRWYTLIVAALAAVGLYFWERRYHRRYRAAVIDPALMRTRSFIFGAAVAFFYFAGFTSIFLVVTLLLQDGLGYSPLAAGLVPVPWAIASGLSAQRSGNLVAKHGRTLVIVGLIIMLIGLIATDLAFRFSSGSAVPWIAAASLAVAGAGSGFVISPNQTLTLAEVSPSIGGVAGGVLQVSQRIGTAIGMAVTLSVFYASLGTHHDGDSMRTAASNGLLVTMVFVAVTLLVAIADARWRRSPSDAA